MTHTTWQCLTPHKPPEMGPSHCFPSPSRVSSLCSQVPSQVPSKGRQICQVPSQVPSKGGQVQVKSQVMSLQVQVLDKSLQTFCDSSVRELTMKLGWRCDFVLPSYVSGHSFEVIVVLCVNAMRSTSVSCGVTFFWLEPRVPVNKRLTKDLYVI